MIEAGQPFPEITVYDAKGEAVALPDALGGHYVVLVRGCLTCPVFWRSYHETEAVSRDYGPKGVKFYFVYGALAHPENNGYVQPFSLEERLMHVAEARRTMETTVPWLADNMENELRWALGNMPNAEVLLDPRGEVVYASSWSSSEGLREALAKEVGPLEEEPTRSRDLGLPRILRQRPRGEALPRVEVPTQLVGVKVTARLSDEPTYAKLRAEAEPSLLSSGDGLLYVGFHLDPLYGTHWNNLTDPLRYKIEAPEGVTVTPAAGAAPTVEQATDSGPREFLVQVAGAEQGSKLTVRVSYYACSDKPAFCKALTQEYEVELVRDPFAGGVSGRSFRFGGRSRSRGRGL